MPKLYAGAVHALRRHLVPELAAQIEQLQSRVADLVAFSDWQTDVLNNHIRGQAKADDEIRSLKTLLEETEAAEMLHQTCWFCSGESSPLRCERCAVMYADLRERRRQALPGGGGGC